MKEKTLIEMKNKQDARVLQQMLNEISHLRDLSGGTIETIKLMPGYEEAIDKLKEKIKSNEEDKE